MGWRTGSGIDTVEVNLHMISGTMEHPVMGATTLGITFLENAFHGGFVWASSLDMFPTKTSYAALGLEDLGQSSINI